jgi:hypothetical protein
MDLKEVGYDDVDRIHLNQDRVQWRTYERGKYLEQLIDNQLFKNFAQWSFLTQERSRSVVRLIINFLGRRSMCSYR